MQQEPRRCMCSIPLAVRAGQPVLRSCDQMWQRNDGRARRSSLRLEVAGWYQ